ncbi:hypothetical protein VTN96DRAFT_2797 [Rasamsonia emersonii]
MACEVQPEIAAYRHFAHPRQGERALARGCWRELQPQLAGHAGGSSRITMSEIFIKAGSPGQKDKKETGTRRCGLLSHNATVLTKALLGSGRAWKETAAARTYYGS